jgi:hypothetical protein
LRHALKKESSFSFVHVSSGGADARAADGRVARHAAPSASNNDRLLLVLLLL